MSEAASKPVRIILRNAAQDEALVDLEVNVFITRQYTFYKKTRITPWLLLQSTLIKMFFSSIAALATADDKYLLLPSPLR